MFFRASEIAFRGGLQMPSSSPSKGHSPCGHEVQTAPHACLGLSQIVTRYIHLTDRGLTIGPGRSSLGALLIDKHRPEIPSPCDFRLATALTEKMGPPLAMDLRS